MTQQPNDLPTDPNLQRNLAIFGWCVAISFGYAAYDCYSGRGLYDWFARMEATYLSTDNTYHPKGMFSLTVLTILAAEAVFLILLAAVRRLFVKKKPNQEPDHQPVK